MDSQGVYSKYWLKKEGVTGQMKKLQNFEIVELRATINCCNMGYYAVNLVVLYLFWLNLPFSYADECVLMV